MPTASCFICAVPLTFAHRRTAPLCGGIACRARYEATPAWRRCTVCARPLGVTELAGRVCAAESCRRELIIAGLQRKRRALADAADRFRGAAAAAAGIEAPDRYPISIVPRISARMTRFPARRRRALAAHLTKLARQAAELRARGISPAAPDVPQAPRDELAAVLGSACGRCRGFCCTTAGDHAYLHVEPLHRWLDAHPEHDADAAVAAYLANVGPSTVRGSCAFHRADGCSLPRDMRADICGRYHCDGLMQIIVAAGDAGPVRAFVAATPDRHSLTTSFHSGAFVDARDVRVVRRADPAPAQPAGTSPALPARPLD